MKKFNLIFISLFSCLITVNAQIGGDGDDGFGQKSKQTISEQGTKGKKINVKTKNYNYEFSVGPRAAVGIATMSEDDGFKLYDGSGMSFGGGAAANIRFGGKDSRGRDLDGQGLLGANLEFNYKHLSVKTLPGDDLKFSYFEVPILLQVYPCYTTKQLKNLYVEAGVTIAGSLSSSPDKISYQKTTYWTGDLKGFDIKPTVGVGYRFSKNSANDGFYVNARYYLGTSKLAGNFPGKISSTELSVGYLFKCIGTKK